MNFLICFAATVFLAFMLKTPRRFIIYSGVVGALGYLVLSFFDSSVYGFFLGGFLVAFISELLVKWLKTPSTVILTVAVIPLVPGMGLYQTMSFLVNNEYYSALLTGIGTMISLGAVALAIAVNIFIFHFAKIRRV